jgi:hypothetical protein
MNIGDTKILNVTFTDSTGIEQDVAPNPIWVSSNTAIATVFASGTGLSASVNAVGPGECQITVTGNADLSGQTNIPVVGIFPICVIDNLPASIALISETI